MHPFRKRPQSAAGLVAAWLYLSAVCAQSGPVRVSFLNNEEALSSTVSILRDAGCQKDGVELFKEAVERYYSLPAHLDLRNFPPAKAGFYGFDSTAMLLSVLPHLCEVEHAAEMNCFDALVLLTAGKFKTSPSVDTPSGPYLVGRMGTNGIRTLEFAATPRAAFALLCPAWYLEANRKFFPTSIATERTCLTAALFSFYVLPATTSRDTLESALLNSLQSGWRRHALEFPKNCQVVLCHWASLDEHTAATRHAGVLFKTQGQSVYIEKCGTAGPFLRLDVENTEDLTAYLEGHAAAHLLDADKPNDNYYFVTFNDTSIQRLRAERWLESVKQTSDRQGKP